MNADKGEQKAIRRFVRLLAAAARTESGEPAAPPVRRHGGGRNLERAGLPRARLRKDGRGREARDPHRALQRTGEERRVSQAEWVGEARRSLVVGGQLRHPDRTVDGKGGEIKEK